MDDDVLTGRGWRQRLGPLLLVNQVSWAYGIRQRIAEDLRGFARADTDAYRLRLVGAGG
jgi:hypothetical protein